jgi:hypothetical protein
MDVYDSNITQGMKLLDSHERWRSSRNALSVGHMDLLHDAHLPNRLASLCFWLGICACGKSNNVVACGAHHHPGGVSRVVEVAVPQ